MIWGCELMILFIENVPRNDSDAPTAKRLSCKCTDQNDEDEDQDDEQDRCDDIYDQVNVWLLIFPPQSPINFKLKLEINFTRPCEGSILPK